MKSIVFDAGPIISLTINGLLWLVKDLKNIFDGKFYIPLEVKREIVDTPLASKRFKLEALKVMHQIDKERFEIITSERIVELGDRLQGLANKSFKIRGNWLKIVDKGEMRAVATAIEMNSEALITDERITRYLIESPEKLKKLLRRRNRTKVHVEDKNLNAFAELVKNIKVIRSLELVAVAFEMGLLNKYISEREEKAIPNLKKQLLESVLWGVKLNGCAASREDIDEIVKMQGF